MSIMDASEGAGTLKTYTEDLHDISTKLTGIGLVTSSNHDRKYVQQTCLIENVFSCKGQGWTWRVHNIWWPVPRLGFRCKTAIEQGKNRIYDSIDWR